MKKYNMGQKLLLRRIKNLKVTDKKKIEMFKVAESIFKKINKK